MKGGGIVSRTVRHSLQWCYHPYGIASIDTNLNLRKFLLPSNHDENPNCKSCFKNREGAAHTRPESLSPEKTHSRGAATSYTSPDNILQTEYKEL